MAESAETLSPGTRYQLEVNGQVVEEFVAPARRNVSIEGLSNTDVFLSKIPGNLETAADPYAKRPPAPPARYTAEGSGALIARSLKELVEKGGVGAYHGRFAAIAASALAPAPSLIRIELDMDSRE